jgi:hypothetical protein
MQEHCGAMRCNAMRYNAQGKEPTTIERMELGELLKIQGIGFDKQEYYDAMR